jgi:hypothetical protein
MLYLFVKCCFDVDTGTVHKLHNTVAHFLNLNVYTNLQLASLNFCTNCNKTRFKRVSWLCYSTDALNIKLKENLEKLPEILNCSSLEIIRNNAHKNEDDQFEWKCISSLKQKKSCKKAPKRSFSKVGDQRPIFDWIVYTCLNWII